MKIEITSAQLSAIVQSCLDLEAIIGCSESENGEKNFDTETKKRLRLIKKMFIKNGYKNPFSTI